LSCFFLPLFLLLQNPLRKKLRRNRSFLVEEFYILVARKIIFEGNSLFIFGGFIRDYLIRGHLHSHMDLDVGFDSMLTPQETMESATKKLELLLRCPDWAPFLRVEGPERQG